MQNTRPVLILGAGINGTAIARELVLRGLPVTLVDTNDIAFGATSRSSRLIHGGLRYLEYGEFDLVRESLGERKHLLASAPHLVRPLRLHTPTQNRLGGFWQSARRFFGWSVKQPTPRGMWLVRIGLWLYQTYAADPDTRAVKTNRPGHGEAPRFGPDFQWVNSYDDGQVLWPERLTLEWLIDAQKVAHDKQLEFRVLTRTKARRDGDRVTLSPTADAEQEFQTEAALQAEETIEPRLVINATGSWVDDALEKLDVESRRLMGGTKGSHLFVDNEVLRRTLGEDGVYVEAADCRPVFILPMHDVILVGTTDIRFEGEPGAAIADEDEVEYLIDAVNRVFPSVQLHREQVVAHYAGVRPLPYVDASTPGAITRRHFLHPHDNASPPILSIIGGKLTTCRALAEEAAEWVMDHHGEGGQTLSESQSSTHRSTPGGADYPDSDALAAAHDRLAEQFQLPTAAIQAVWRLYGVRSAEVLQTIADYESGSLEIIAPELPLPWGLARYVVEHEWARSLEDIVERRMFLVHSSRLRREWLGRLAEACGIDSSLDRDAQVQRCIDRLKAYYGRSLED